MTSELLDESQSEWTFESFYETFHPKFYGMAQRANWTDSGQDADDLEQFLWEHFWKIWDRAKEWPEKTVITHASRKVREKAKEERVAYEEFRCEYVYTEDYVKGALRECAWSDIENCPDVDARVDIHMAFRTLTHRQREVLFSHYALGEPLAEDSADARAHSRAVRALTRAMNQALPRTTQSLDVSIDQGEL